MGARIQGRGRGATLGSDHRDAGGSRALTRVAQVVPGIPSFSVDDGFAYSIPAGMDGLAVGSIVRVPLGARRVRGWVTAVTDERQPGDRLRDIASVSGDLPVFDERLLATTRWVATHYVAPLAAVLTRCAPPNLPRLPAPTVEGPSPSGSSDLAQLGRGLIDRRVVGAHYLIAGADPSTAIFDLAGPAVAEGRNVFTILPTVVEARRLHADAKRVFGGRASLATSALDAATRTRAWMSGAVGRGVLIIGTREVALWPAPQMGLAVLVEEGRRGMKSQQTPTIHVREVMRRRAALERFGLVYRGPVPTGETLAAGVRRHPPPSRAWPLVEVVDRTEEPPGSGFVSDRVRRALGSITRAGDRSFVLVSRHAPTSRCVRCRTIRRCPVCGAGPDRGPNCVRCGAEVGPCSTCGGARFELLGGSLGRIIEDLQRSFGDRVGTLEEERAIAVGTERDLPEVSNVAVAVSVDADSAILAPHYRAGEEALRLLARLAAVVAPGRGHRCMVQTGLPDHPVIEAFRTGRPFPFMDRVLEERERTGLPPVGELIAIEVTGGDDADRALREVVSGREDLHGPAAVGDGQRWIVQGADLRSVRLRLRSVVQSLRDGGARVRVDADPVDL